MSEKEEVNVKNEETKTTAKKGTKKSTTTKKSSTATTKKSTTSKTTASKETTKKATGKTSTTKSTTTQKATSTKKETDKPKTTTAKKTTKKTTTTRTTKPKVVKKIEENNEEKVEVVKNDVNIIEKKAEEIKKEPKAEETKKEDKAEFRKVEVNNKKESKPKKNHRIIKFILILIIIALVMFFVNFARNFIIVNEIIEKQVSLKDKTNYSYTIEEYTGNSEKDKTTLKYFYKDGKCMAVTNSGIRWQDEKTKEMVVMSTAELKAIVTSSETKLLGMPTFSNENNNFLRLSFMYLITTDTVDGQECYKIRYMDEIRWVSKENGTILKDMYGKTVVNGEEYENVKYFKDWKFDKLTDNDLSRPNLIGYDVTYEK